MKKQKKKKKRKESIKYIADHYGFTGQSEVCIEEMSELIQALIKYEYRGGEIQNVIEEIADVQIMLWQLLYLLKCNDDASKIIDMKLKRQIGRIKGE